jgi:hypothetical protein
MKNTPDYTQDYPSIGTVRFYEENGRWRYIHAGGEGAGLPTLEAAQEEIETFLATTHDEK